MEQLNDLLGYVSVFLWAFGICQVKATRDKKRWVLSGIFGIGAVLIIFLYFKNELLYWIKWLLFFFTVYVFDRRKMETKSCLIVVFHRIYRCYIYSYPDSDGYNRIYKEKRVE